jgi:hypothetical protein
MMGALCEHQRHRALLLLLLSIFVLIAPSSSHLFHRNDKRRVLAGQQQGTSSEEGVRLPGRVLAGVSRGADPPGRAFNIKSRAGGVPGYLNSLGSSKVQRILQNSKLPGGFTGRQKLEELLQRDADLVSNRTREQTRSCLQVQSSILQQCLLPVQCRASENGLNVGQVEGCSADQCIK